MSYGLHLQERNEKLRKELEQQWRDEMNEMKVRSTIATEPEYHWLRPLCAMILAIVCLVGVGVSNN